MKQLPEIKLYRGATTVVNFGLSDFDMQDGKVVLTLSDKKGIPVKFWETDKAEVWSVVFENEFTAGLKIGEGKYIYDLMHHVNGEQFAQCEPSPVTVFPTAGGYWNEPNA